LLHGAGGTTLFTLGVTYLDENVSQVKSSLYHGKSTIPQSSLIIDSKFLITET